MRWCLVDTDKTYLQKKYLKETPTDNRDMGQSVGEHMFVNHVGTNQDNWQTCWS